MTDFGTMSVTRSLSISTRNTSTTSGIPHFQSGFGTFYGSMPLKDHDLTSMTYPGFYGNHSGEFFPSQPVNNGLSINSGGTTCHQQQFQQQQQQQQHNQEHHHYHHQQQQQQHQQQQQQQQNKRRGEWITFSKPFLLKLVEKLCQLSFETEVVPSPAPEVSSQGGPVDQKVKTNQSSVNILTGNPSVSPSEATNSESSYSPSISLATTALTTATTTPLVNVQTSNDKINNNNNSSSGVCSRKSRQKSRPVKFVRPFESSEERQKSEDSDINVESDDDDDNDDTTMKKNNNKSSSGNSSNTISAVVSPTPANPSCVAVAANSSSAVSVVAGGKSKENLKRERDACEDSETEHVNVEDDDDDDGDTNAPTAKTKTTDHPGSENIHGREVTGKDQSILERSFQSAKLHFNPGSSSAPPPPTHHPHHHLFNPLWSEYFKLNFGLQPTYQPAFNSHKGTPQAEPSRQSWAAFNKSLVYKMFDEVLDNDKTHNGAATYQPGAQPAQSALHDARFLFASHRPGHLGLHLSNGLDKHLGTYDVAFCQGRVGQVRDSHDDDRENKRSSVGQVRNKRLRDGFARGRHQLINKRNKVRSSCATKVTCPRNSGLERKEQSERSNCKDANPVCDVPILGALLSSNDTKLYSSNRSLHNSVNNNNNNNSNKYVKVCSEQQHNTILKPTTANNNNNTSPISCDIPLKNGLRQNPSSGKVEGWPKWVALDKGQVKSLVDSLVATMMGTGDGQSPSSCHSMTPPPPKSRDDDSEMQVDGNSNEESSQQHQQQQLQQQQTATSDNVSVEEDIKESADVDHATSNNSSGTSTYQSPQSSPKSCGVEIERSAPPTHNNNNENSSSSSSSNRDSETETNFSGDTQLDQSDLDEYSGRQVEEDMSDDGESSARDADTDDCARMECHSTHRRCPIKWKSNMLKRMKAEKRRPET